MIAHESLFASSWHHHSYNLDFDDYPWLRPLLGKIFEGRVVQIAFRCRSELHSSKPDPEFLPGILLDEPAQLHVQFADVHVWCDELGVDTITCENIDEPLGVSGVPSWSVADWLKASFGVSIAAASFSTAKAVRPESKLLH